MSTKIHGSSFSPYNDIRVEGNYFDKATPLKYFSVKNGVTLAPSVSTTTAEIFNNASTTNSLIGNFGVGTTTPAYPISSSGKIYSASGGYVFPDGTLQTTAASALNLYASTTIGGGTQTTGLTVFGGATSTQTFNIGNGVTNRKNFLVFNPGDTFGGGSGEIDFDPGASLYMNGVHGAGMTFNSYPSTGNPFSWTFNAGTQNAMSLVWESSSSAFLGIGRPPQAPSYLSAPAPHSSTYLLPLQAHSLSATISSEVATQSTAPASRKTAAQSLRSQQHGPLQGVHSRLRVRLRLMASRPLPRGQTAI